MNVYINRSFNNANLMILVAANSKEEAWKTIINGENGRYYLELYDDYAFILIKGVTANTDVPKIVYETTLNNDDFPL